MGWPRAEGASGIIPLRPTLLGLQPASPPRNRNGACGPHSVCERQEGSSYDAVLQMGLSKSTQLTECSLDSPWMLAEKTEPSVVGRADSMGRETTPSLSVPLTKSEHHLSPGEHFLRLQQSRCHQGPAGGWGGARHDWYLRLPALSSHRPVSELALFLSGDTGVGGVLSVSSAE